jgi:hypothetical protein
VVKAKVLLQTRRIRVISTGFLRGLRGNSVQYWGFLVPRKTSSVAEQRGGEKVHDRSGQVRSYTQIGKIPSAYANRTPSFLLSSPPVTYPSSSSPQRAHMSATTTTTRSYTPTTAKPGSIWAPSLRLRLSMSSGAITSSNSNSLATATTPTTANLPACASTPSAS